MFKIPPPTTGRQTTPPQLQNLPRQTEEVRRPHENVGDPATFEGVNAEGFARYRGDLMREQSECLKREAERRIIQAHHAALDILAAPPLPAPEPLKWGAKPLRLAASGQVVLWQVVRQTDPRTFEVALAPWGQVLEFPSREVAEDHAKERNGTGAE